MYHCMLMPIGLDFDLFIIGGRFNSLAERQGRQDSVWLRLAYFFSSYLDLKFLPKVNLVSYLQRSFE